MTCAEGGNKRPCRLDSSMELAESRSKRPCRLDRSEIMKKIKVS